MDYVFLFLCIPDNFSSDARYYEFYLVWWWIFLFSYKYSWTSFWDMAKLLGINLVIWGLAVKLYRVGPEQCLVQCFFLTLRPWVSTLPNALWMMRFYILGGGNRNLSAPEWVPRIMPTNPFQWFFPFIQALISTQLKTQRGNSANLRISFSAQLSPPHSRPENSNHLDILDSLLHLLYWGEL